MKRFIVGFIPLSFMVGLPTIAGRMAWACLCCLRRDCIRRVPCLRHSRYDGTGFQHGGAFRMQPREQFDTGVDTGRNDAALKRAEPGRPGRTTVFTPRTARSLAAVLLVAFAAILALPPQAQAQTGICGRTQQVRAAIRAKIPGPHCANVTATHLAGITGLLDLRTRASPPSRRGISTG